MRIGVIDQSSLPGLSISIDLFAVPAVGVSVSGQYLEMSEKRPLRFVRSIEGATVYDPLSVRIGTIDRLLIDPGSWRVRVLLVSFDIPGVSGKPLPLPWRVIQYNAYADRFFTLVDQDPTFSCPAVR